MAIKNILCVVGKKGRVQYDRMVFLSKYFNHNLTIVSNCTDTKYMNKHDLVYFSHFSLLETPRLICKCICSVTSHKCLSEFDKTINKLKSFDGISVNNNILFGVFKKSIKKLCYTPNGVDTCFFVPKNKPKNKVPVIGWVGNVDRETKNFKTIVHPLIKQMENVTFNIVATSKKDDHTSLKTKEEMRDYYQGLDFFLISSSTEGTPNPGLEALSSGIPVITTKVGNMVDIVVDGYNGMYVEDNICSVENGINSIIKCPDQQYNEMRANARDVICKHWDWDITSKMWVKFFEDFL